MASFQETLKKLISRNIVITKTKSGKLKTIDFNKSQSTGSPTQYQNRPKWKISRGYSTTSGYGSGFTNEEIEALRKQMYQDYDIMDTDAIVSSVIDIYSDECSTNSEQGELLIIKTNDERIKKILHNLFYDIMNIDFNLWPWIRTSCKYGDNFLYLQIAEGVGVVNVMPIHPLLIIREEGINGDPQSIRFRYEGEYGQGWSPNHYFEETEIAHFRLLSDVNFLPYGRCLDKYSYVNTEFGLKTIDCIEVGESVWTFNLDTSEFELSEVVAKSESGKKQLFEIKSFNFVIHATENHPILVIDDDAFEYKPVANLKIGDIVVFDNGLTTNNFKNYVKIDKSIDKLSNKNGWKNQIDLIPEYFTEEFARLYGFLLGDGWLIHSYHALTGVAFAQGIREDRNKYYQNLLEKFTGKEARFTKELIRDNIPCQCIIGSKLLATILRMNGFEGNAHTKRLPNWIYNSPESVKMQFIRGFVDADGSIFTDKWNVKRYNIELCNKELCYDIRELLISMGIKASVVSHRINKSRTIKKSIVGDTHSYYFYFYLDAEKIKQKAKYNKLNKSNLITQKITSITDIGIDETFDIQVKSANSNFIANGFIVHNSILEGGRQEFKRMRLMEESMMLNRIMRAPERRLFKIDIGNIAPEEVDAYIEEISNSMKKTPYIDPTTGDFNLRYNILNSQEDFFLPVRGSDSGTTIETLPGLQNDKMLDDVEYFKNKMISAFKVPKDYLGYGGEEQGGSGGKAQLASIDIRFARTIERVQKIFVSEFYKIALIHLISQGFEGEDLLNFELSLTNPSLVFERQKTDVMTARVDLAKSAREENPLLSDIYIYKNLWGFTDEEIEMLKLQKIEDAKFQFRLKQIVEEGNDPEVTGKSFGTPHDIATMQVASKFMPGQYGETNKSLYTKDERENNDGKPDQHKSSFETRRDQDFGDDPVGRKDMNKMENLIKKYAKFKPKSKAEPQMLSEENLLKIEDNYN